MRGEFNSDLWHHKDESCHLHRTIILPFSGFILCSLASPPRDDRCLKMQDPNVGGDGLWAN